MRTENLSVVHVWDRLGPLAGVERVVLEIVRRVEARHTVCGWEGGQLASEAEQLGANVRVLSRTSAVGGGLEIASLMRKSPNVSGRTILHVHGHWAAPRAAIAGLVLRCPVIWTLHADVERELQSTRARIRTVVLSALMSKVTCVTGQSARTLADLQRRYTLGQVLRSPQAIYNGVDCRSLLKFASEKNRGRIYQFVVVSRLSPEKRVADVIAALAALGDRGIRPTVLFVGDGPEQEALVSQASRTGVLDQCTFVGWAEDTSEYMLQADALIYTSAYGALGLSAFEAMSLGLLAILPDQGGARDVLTHNRDCLLYDRSDIGSLAHCLELALDPVSRGRIAALGRASVMQKFDVERTTAQYVDLYQQAVGAPAADAS